MVGTAATDWEDEPRLRAFGELAAEALTDVPIRRSHPARRRARQLLECDCDELGDVSGVLQHLDLADDGLELGVIPPCLRE